MADTPIPEATPPKAKGGGMKKIIFILVGVIALAGAGFGGMMIGKKKAGSVAPDKAKDAAGEVAEDAAKGGDGEKAAEEGEGEKKEDGGEAKEGEKAEGGHGGGEAAKGATEAESLAFDLDKLTVNLADPSGRRYVQATLQLQASSPKALKEIESNKAPLIDATLTLLATKTREDLQPPAARERLKRELMTRYDGILAPKSVENIYITQMVFQ